jgi:hypothetical protein
VIEIDGAGLYIHNRDEFESGNLNWGHMSPLEIAKSSASKQEIVAFSFSQGAKNGLCKR